MTERKKPVLDRGRANPRYHLDWPAQPTRSRNAAPFGRDRCQSAVSGGTRSRLLRAERGSGDGSGRISQVVTLHPASTNPDSLRRRPPGRCFRQRQIRFA
jgi:hypothetical protein